MLPQPTLHVMKKERDVYEVEVAAARPTRHSVTAGVGDVERLTGGRANAERLIEESFRFLLERSRTLRFSAPSRSPTSATIFPNTNARFAAVSAVLHEEARKPLPAGNLDALVNKYLAAFRNVDQLLAQAQAQIQTYRERYPELAASLPEGTPDRQTTVYRRVRSKEQA